MDLSSAARLTIRDATCRGVRVPLTFALGTSAAIVRQVPLLLVDLTTEEGVVGRAYLFAYTDAGARSIADLIGEAVAGVRGQPCAPAVLAPLLGRRWRLLGVAGPVRMALSILDIAMWDAVAVAAGRPLATLLGAGRGAIPAYDSRGLGLMEAARLADEAERLCASGLGAVKLRLGYPTLAEDLAALAAVRSRLPPGMPVMVDYNQALTVAEALERGRALDQAGVAWLEEPIRHDDYRGAARLAAALAVPVQIGENFNGPAALSDALAAGACDHVMPDVARIGGVTGWMQAAGIAAAAGIEMSSHLMPELSVHLLAASPTAHWLEYVDWADAVLEQPLEIRDGAARVPDRPGLGIAWSAEKLRRLATI
ncbi:enolase C-terminal domain-like protein [Stella sp.]|uniref:enolase C-terminal domain-like protein n=1 Tax=Stella sp. TaxID=2912054 RepID=UPI0035B37BC9